MFLSFSLSPWVFDERLSLIEPCIPAPKKQRVFWPVSDRTSRDGIA